MLTMPLPQGIRAVKGAVSVAIATYTDLPIGGESVKWDLAFTGGTPLATITLYGQILRVRAGVASTGLVWPLGITVLLDDDGAGSCTFTTSDEVIYKVKASANFSVTVTCLPDGATGVSERVLPPDNISRPIDDRIYLLAANNSTKQIYSTQNHGAPSYVRSGTCWGAGFDLTCVSPWNSGNAHLWAGTAITPRHIVMAQHAYVVNGSTMRFIAADNTIVTTTLSSAMQVAGTDIRIGLLSGDLPGTIKPAKLLPDDYADWWLTVPGTACFFIDQEEKLLVAEITQINPYGEVNIGPPPTGTHRLSFYETPVDGDSGNPIMMSISGETVLLGCFYSATDAPSLIQNNRAGVVAAINTLGAFGHAPQNVVYAG